MKWEVYLSSILALFFYLSSLTNVEGQIPLVCASDRFLQGDVRMCCPDNCGETRLRGHCVSVNITQSSDGDSRINWPIHYFTHVCRCVEGFGGVGCESCAYGYYGESDDCRQNYTGARRNLKDYSDQDWSEYREILKMARNTDSKYVAIVDGSRFNPQIGYSSIENEVRRISLYNFFVWTHYLVAKDSERTGVLSKDFAHESTGFLTWHRQMLLWFEWKIQEMLRDKNDPQYYRFRLPYWDWTDKTQRMAHFEEDRLGATLHTRTGDQNNHVVHDTSQPENSQLFGSNGTNWTTICWGSKQGPPDDGSPCDPGHPVSVSGRVLSWSETYMPTGPLKRCPNDACDSDNQYWPSVADVNKAVNIGTFDAQTYDTCSTGSFRNYLEGFSVVPQCSESDRMCTESDNTTPCNRARRLHNSVHLILGAGDLTNLRSEMDENNLGVMAHVAASPNDPIFINHHTMIDCIFEEWLKRNRQASYPNNVNISDGHRRDDYIVPFMPVFTHTDMFKTANNFGYSCDLSHITNSGGGSNVGGGGNSGGAAEGGGTDKGSLAGAVGIYIGLAIGSLLLIILVSSPFIFLLIGVIWSIVLIRRRNRGRSYI